MLVNRCYLWFIFSQNPSSKNGEWLIFDTTICSLQSLMLSTAILVKFVSRMIFSFLEFFHAASEFLSSFILRNTLFTFCDVIYFLTSEKATWIKMSKNDLFPHNLYFMHNFFLLLHSKWKKMKSVAFRSCILYVFYIVWPIFLFLPPMQMMMKSLSEKLNFNNIGTKSIQHL